MPKIHPAKRVFRAHRLSYAVSIVSSLTLFGCGTSSGDAPAAPEMTRARVQARAVSVEGDGTMSDGEGADGEGADGEGVTGGGADGQGADGQGADGQGGEVTTGPLPGDTSEVAPLSTDSTETTPMPIVDETAGQTDTDKDGLADSAETNTGVFVSIRNTGTDPNLKDTDMDGLSDSIEVATNGLNLPAMGVSPLHRDILIEYDWLEDSTGCFRHSHRPKPEMLARVDAAFAAAPVKNPDGTSGIKLIHDYGQGGAFTGGTKITAKTMISQGATSAEFQGYKKANFAANRDGVFHWALMAHRYSIGPNGTGNTKSSGNAEWPGSALMVTLACDKKVNDIANTLMHELGHNLSLSHGGDQLMSNGDDRNDKPNYNSVMNYRYQFEGIDTNCDGKGDKLLDYSYGKLASLNEKALDERIGLCSGKPIDWNKKNGIEASVMFDINGDKELTELTDFDDWTTVLRRKTLVRFVQEPQSLVCRDMPETAETGDGTETGETGDTGTPANTADTGEVGNISTPETPASPVDTGETANPADTGETANPADTGETANPGEIANPAEE